MGKICCCEGCSDENFLVFENIAQYHLICGFTINRLFFRMSLLFGQGKSSLLRERVGSVSHVQLLSFYSSNVSRHCVQVQHRLMWTITFT